MAIRAEWSSPLARVLRRKASPQAAVQWQPHSDGSPTMAWLRSRNPHATFVAGALIGSLLIGTSTWLMGGHSFNLPSFGETQVASTAPRYAPLSAVEQPSPTMRSGAELAVTNSAQTARLVADQEIVELQVGRRARLGARIDDADALKPETLALISGLPEDVQLSDGIKINTQLWMLRSDLLSSVEVDAARASVGRYPITLELRTPEGHVISNAQTTLVIVSAVEGKPAATQSTPAVAGERKDTATTPSAKDEQSAAPTAVTSAPAKSETVRTARPRVDSFRQVKTQSPARTVVTRPEPILSPKPVQKSRPARPDTTASVPPVVAQGPQSQQKLVWPGDNPRAVYTQSPPFFLGGAVPNTAPQSQPAPVQNDNWHRRVFETPGQ